MKKITVICSILTGIFSLSLLMTSGAVVAHEKVIVVPLGGSANKIPNSDKPCDSSTAGLIRWTGSDFEGCDGRYWARFSLTATVPTVFSSGNEWMDRNLGADQAATSSTDSAAYGDLYQWGRLTDGHEDRTITTTTTEQSPGDVPGHGMFIVGHYDWRIPGNGTLWQTSAINNPCPTGFRVPTYTEWEAELSSWGNKDSTGALSSPLKLVMAGYRDGFTNGTIMNTGSIAKYWSSTALPGTIYANLLGFSSGSASMQSDPRGFGMSVRCIKD